MGTAELWAAHSKGSLPTDQQRLEIQRAIIAGLALSSCYEIGESGVRFMTQATPKRELPQATLAFLQNATWQENGCILDDHGVPLRLSDFPALQSARLKDLHVQPEAGLTTAGEHAAIIRPSCKRGKEVKENLRQITRWCRSIMLSLPWTVWTSIGSITQPIGMPVDQQRITWTYNSARRSMEAKLIRTTDPAFTVMRNLDGLSWRLAHVSPEYRQTEDFEQIAEWANWTGIAFTQPHKRPSTPGPYQRR
ncbi:hypothetical protein PHYSODRAFT_300814 [Phytophthora sojae]|uniref:Uncharacterized protein n=1 Tax=Phytophthora sojae (strain P6497) TaxID=1094619 RepID=G4ZF05_PHYSP|nr:hypothetical protein PHYSODRAFT_300814 [Phytophthora sojae]EGZ17917.1 hypothetical protein PHYSODRAFT_300814 [Phytophthora sojae]|eukprot:XP_009526975.1 hypothetical protein PHYSODRAFT_300814 [Phytophthora sojae]